jgi:xanthine dehydrogenase YagR molybdenum-binding subunit
VIQLAGHEIGNGAYTVVALTVAESLGLDLARVKVMMGDSDLPPVTIAGGSNNAASTAHVAARACEEVRRRLAEAAAADDSSPHHGADPAALTLTPAGLTGKDGRAEPLATALGRVTNGALEIHAENLPDGLPPSAMADLYKGKAMMSRGTSRKDVTAFAFGAHFVELRIHARTRELRAHRVVSAFSAGTIVNPLTAYSQFMGGAIWGLSSALYEATEIDPKTARYVNDNLADYLVPVCADVPDIEILVVPETDHRVNPLGIKAAVLNLNESQLQEFGWGG